MCLIAVAYGVHPDIGLAVAANRDEYHQRPTLAADFWPDHPHVLAGRDLEAGGTWMGVTRSGRFAALANYAAIAQDGPKSRGHLVGDFLKGGHSALDYARGVRGEDYAGFNLVLFDGESLVYFSNTQNEPIELDPGVHGISNAALDADWPKMRASSALLRGALDSGIDKEKIIAGMQDKRPPPDSELPAGDAPLELRRRTSSCFVIGEDYGTRSTTLIFVRPELLEFEEHSYGPEGQATGRRSFALTL